MLYRLLRKHKKSSYYTFINPIAGALVLAGRNTDDVLPEVEAYGLPAGLAFQLRDDWLGIFGDPAQSGKANTDDIREGKVTFLMKTAVEKASHEDKTYLLDSLGNAQISDDDVRKVREILTKTGAVDANEQMMEKARKEAIDATSAHSWSSSIGELLTELVTYSVGRTKRRQPRRRRQGILAILWTGIVAGLNHTACRLMKVTWLATMH